MDTPEGRSALERFAHRDYAIVVASVARITGDPQGASDAVQDAVVGFLENPPRHPVDNLAAWLTVVAVPLALNASVVLLSGGAASDELRERERVSATARRRP